MKQYKLLCSLALTLFTLLFAVQVQACDSSPVITYPGTTDLGNGTYEVDINICVGNGGSESGWTTDFDGLNIISFSPAALTNGANTATGSITGGVLDYSYPGNGSIVDVFAGQNTNTCFDYTVIVDGDPTGISVTYIGVNCESVNCPGSCSVISGDTQAAVIPPPPPICGQMFYDAGGPDDPYPPGLNYTVTVCPTVPGDPVTVDFTFFDLSGAYYYSDALTIYDGPDFFSPFIGNFTDMNSPGTVTATGATGCLTFQFNSSYFGSGGIGWEALVICDLECDLAIDSATGTDITCNGADNGTINIITTGGTAPLTYTWDNGLPATQNQVGLTDGTYTVTVTDVDDCEAITTVSIAEPALLQSDAVSSTPVSCFGGSDGTASTAAIGATPPYTFSWNTTPVQNTSTATGLSAGTYTATIGDANNCEILINVTVTQPALALTTSISGVDPDCANGTDGSATVTPSGGTPGYTYVWSNADTTSTITGLDAGIYNVTVTDANMCAIISAITLLEPVVLIATATGEDLACISDQDGDISLTVNNGTPPYSFQWSNGSNIQNPSGLGIGVYSVVVTDANLCSVTASAEITSPPALLATVTGQSVSCFGLADGSATATPSGGTAPYTFLWDNNETTNPAILLDAGLHIVTITDANACTVIETVAISSPAPLSPTGFSEPVSCFGGSDGSATAGAMGGTPPYSFSWNTTPVQTGATATGLSAGTVQVSIIDANGCDLPPINITVTEPDEAVTAIINPEDPFCNGGNDGSASVVPSGGTASYTYQWSTGAFGQTAFDLATGTYSVTVTDANGCTFIESTTLGEPSSISATFSTVDNICYGDESGSILIETALGGVAPYTYSLDGETFVPSDYFGGLGADNYTIYVQDANGCENTFPASITQPFQLLVDLGPDITIELTDTPTLFAQTNTTDSLTYTWTPEIGLSCTSNCAWTVVETFEPMTYTVTVRDTFGCTASDEIKVMIDKERNVFVPNVFSPDGDGTNDTFLVYGGKGVEQINLFTVYDRWGELLFEAKNFQPNDEMYGWNGNLRSKEMNTGVFVYYVEATFVDGIKLPYRGSVTLVRQFNYE